MLGRNSTGNRRLPLDVPTSGSETTTAPQQKCLLDNSAVNTPAAADWSTASMLVKIGRLVVEVSFLLYGRIINIY